jgi:alanyl-tRNA synthetase
MHKALREVLGAHVQQKGSLVDAGADRASTSAHHAPMTRGRDPPGRGASSTREILANAATAARGDGLSTTRSAAGAMALFGEKYGDECARAGHRHRPASCAAARM